MPAQTMWACFVATSASVRRRSSGFPGEGSGRLRAYQSWRPIEQATMSYGHGISVSLLQLARAYTIFATDGELQAGHAGQARGAEPGVRVIVCRRPRGPCARCWRWRCSRAAPRRARRSRAIASPAKPAPRTSSKAARYAPNKYVSSFVGFAPASEPRLIVAVMIDEPSAGQYYGGAVAAPVFAT